MQVRIFIFNFIQVRYLFAKKNCQSPPPSEIIYVHSLNMLDFSPTPK
jgi:hypothetical protein